LYYQREKNPKDCSDQDLIKIFAKGIGTTAGGEVCRPSEVNVPVQLHSNIQTESTTVNPGDYTVADLDGVVCIPKNLLDKVLEFVPSIVENDSKCAEAIGEGMSIEEAFKRYRG
jgi:regulator of RNase E activity RraA